MVRTIDPDKLIDRVSQLMGATTKEGAARAVLATLKALGEGLLADEAHSLARAFPPELAPTLESAAHLGRLTPDGLVARVAKHEGVALGFAHEHAQSVFRALGELLPEESRVHLERVLAPEVARLFHASDAAEPEAPPHAPRTGRRTLSEGSLEATHPIAEAAVEAGQRNSVARASNPHAETKLSSSHGLTQEELGESLATGHPSTRPISEGRK
jgi:uncharacterized protein (DUF2267 family)